MVSFFIKERNRAKTSIYCSVNFNGIKRFIFRLKNLEINTKDWDSGRMKTGRGKQDIGRTQSILDNLRTDIEEFFKEYLRAYNRRATKDDILNFLQSEKNQEDYIQPKTVINIIPEIEMVINRRKDGSDLNKGRRFSYNTIRSYGTFLSTIKEFEIQRTSRLNSKNIILEETIYEFQMFLTKKKIFN